MKIVIACDSFKESMTSIEAGEAVERAALAVFPQAEVIVSPLADGGEGTAEALLACLGGKMIECDVQNPLGETITATYALTDNNIAVIDVAAAAGLALVPPEERDPLGASTYGVGQMIDNAIRRGCRDFIIGLGGSATVDGGVGMLEALGLKFYNRFGDRIRGLKGADVAEIKHIDFSDGNRHIPDCRFRIACDVENPLCGANGAAEVYGPQKGADEKAVQFLDTALFDLADMVKMKFHRDTKNLPGAGAAGGLGWAFVTFLNGTLEKGTDIVADTTDLKQKLEGADLFVTGEGKMDSQSVQGKAPVSAAALAKECGAKTVAFCGCVGEGAELVNDAGIDAFFPILRSLTTREEALDPATAAANLEATATQYFKVLKSFEI
ncbi:MAG: glycerate kinase [Clostridia bacterium]|nr:glycerate kinase [Clostridia bacterium]